MITKSAGKDGGGVATGVCIGHGCDQLIGVYEVPSSSGNYTEMFSGANRDTDISVCLQKIKVIPEY